MEPPRNHSVSLYHWSSNVRTDLCTCAARSLAEISERLKRYLQNGNCITGSSCVTERDTRACCFHDKGGRPGVPPRRCRPKGKQYRIAEKSISGSVDYHFFPGTTSTGTFAFFITVLMVLPTETPESSPSLAPKTIRSASTSLAWAMMVSITSPSLTTIL